MKREGGILWLWSGVARAPLRPINGIALSSVMFSPQIIVPFFIAPLFPAIPIALARPKGHRLIAALGVFACAEYLAVVLFGSLSLVNFLILCALYGPHTVVTGEIHVVRGRHFMEMSNGDKYEGLSFALWLVADFVMLISTVLVTRRLGKLVYAHLSFVRRLVTRFSQSMTAKPAAR